MGVTRVDLVALETAFVLNLLEPIYSTVARF